MAITISIAVGAIVLQVVGLIVAAVWVVGKIDGATGKLGTNIKHLANAVESLKTDGKETDTKVDAHGERLARLEAVNKQ